jgi:hypothetical protein
MTDLRAAAQQALEALEKQRSYFLDRREEAPDHVYAAIRALRAALEQPNRAQQQRDAGFTRRPTIREMSEPEQPEQEPHWLTKELMADYLDMVAEAIEENRSEMLRHKAHWMRKRGEV